MITTVDTGGSPGSARAFERARQPRAGRAQGRGLLVIDARQLAPALQSKDARPSMAVSEILINRAWARQRPRSSSMRCTTMLPVSRQRRPLPTSGRATLRRRQNIDNDRKTAIGAWHLADVEQFAVIRV